MDKKVKLKGPSLEKLIAMSPSDRAVLYQNCKKHLAEGGQEIIDLIDSHNLSVSSGDMLSSDPDYLEMQTIIWSTEGKAAALQAVSDGLPALQGLILS